VTGGEAPPEDNYTMEPSEHPGPPVGLDEAITVAERRFPGASPTWVGLPKGEDGFYSIDLIDGGPDLWAHNAVCRGNRSVGVDALDPGNVRVFLGPSQTVSNAIADEWAQPALHYGHAVGPLLAGPVVHPGSRAADAPRHRTEHVALPEAGQPSATGRSVGRRCSELDSHRIADRVESDALIHAVRGRVRQVGEEHDVLDTGAVR